MFKAIYLYMRNIFSMNAPTKKVFQGKIYSQVLKNLSSAYQYPQLLQYLRSLPVESLLSKSVENFVGSRSVPRNAKVLKILMNLAEEKARNNEKLTILVKYYRAFFDRLSAVQQKNQYLYKKSSDQLKQLADIGHNLSNYVIGRDLLNQLQNQSIQNLINFKQKVNQIFLISINDKQYGGMYFIANYHQKLNSGIETDEQFKNILLQLYIQSASQGNPLSLYKLSQMYIFDLLRYKTNKQYQMFRKYLLSAAELGSVQAQHTIAKQYQSGIYFPKDEVKSFAWHTLASTNGNIHSKYRVSQIFSNGSECGRILQNKKEALVQLQEIKKTGLLNVDKDIQQINAFLNK